MKRVHRLIICLSLFFFCIDAASAQMHWSLGLGGAVVSNDEGHNDFNSFLVPQVYLNYRFTANTPVQLGLESFLSIRKSNEDTKTRYGSALSFPLTVRYKVGRVRFFTGAGIAYTDQRLEDNRTLASQHIGGFYGDLTSGLGLTLKKTDPAIVSNFPVSIDFRVHFLPALSKSNENGGIISLLLVFN